MQNQKQNQKLRHKAKTRNTLNIECGRMSLREFSEKQDEEWVRLEDAQKEIDLANKDFKEQYKEAERLSNLLRNAENEHLILKQKLQQLLELLKEIEEKRGPYSQDQLTHAENVINNSSENAKKIRLILEGLLKEEKMPPT